VDLKLTKTELLKLDLR